MSNRWRLVTPIALLLVGTVALACEPADPAGGSPSPSPVTSPAASVPATSPDAGGSPAASPSASAAASPSASAGAAGDLASLIPETVGDATMSVTSIDAQTLIAVNPSRQLQPLLTAAGASLDGVEAVTATGGTDTATLLIDAFRIPGADAASLMTQLQTALEAAPGAAVETTNLGGKDVISFGTGNYAYASGDVLFFVVTTDEELATAAFSALP